MKVLILEASMFRQDMMTSGTVVPESVDGNSHHASGDNRSANLTNEGNMVELAPCCLDGGKAIDRHQIRAKENPHLVDGNLVPKIGMEFDNEQEAYDFYNAYAKEKGFSVRINSWRKNKMGEICRKTFVCYKEGVSRKKTVVIRVRAESRCGCLARMIIRRGKNGRLYVSDFQPVHNHQFVTSSNSAKLRSHRKPNDADSMKAHSQSNPLEAECSRLREECARLTEIIKQKDVIIRKQELQIIKFKEQVHQLNFVESCQDIIEPKNVEGT